MDSACPKELATQILSDSDHSTKVAPTTLNLKVALGSAIQMKRCRREVSIDMADHRSASLQMRPKYTISRFKLLRFTFIIRERFPRLRYISAMIHTSFSTFRRRARHMTFNMTSG